jgi:hypothetical protein
MHNHPPSVLDIQRGYTNTMIPADAGLSLSELVRIALYNIDQFDKVAMDGETQKVGNTTYHSTGDTSQKVGKTTYNSDGTSCRKVGKTTYCD